MRQVDADEGITVLKRAPILAALATGPLTRRDLQDRFDLSRTTAYRVTVDLEDRGLIERIDRGYELTAKGVAVAGSCDRFVVSLQVGDRLSPLLEHVDDPELTGSLDVFADATVLVANEHEPFRLIEWWTDRLRTVERMRSLTVSAGRTSDFELVINRMEAGADIEAIMSPQALESSKRTAGTVVADFVDRFPGRTFVHDNVPFNCTIFDDTVAIAGVDQHTGVPAAHVSTDASHAREWAERLYARYRRSAGAVTPEQLTD